MDAPAVIPTLIKFFDIFCLCLFFFSLNSEAFSTKTVSGCISRHTSNSLLVFELSRPPMTIITSESFASSAAAFCLSEVALHIVSKKSTLVKCFFKICTTFLNKFSLMVVWATTERGKSFGFDKISLKSSSSPTIEAEFPHQPFMPMTSGWSLFPTITICLFFSKNSRLTMEWIFFTKGQVASATSTDLASKASISAFFTPWALIITREPGSASFGDSMERTPLSSKLRVTSRL